MGTNAVQRDATAETVSANVRRLRTDQNLGLRGLAKKLGEVGRALGHSAVDQIEKGTRRVDVDDLMALAAALKVSPITLLLPNTDDPDAAVSSTGAVDKLTADQLLDWLQAKNPLPGDDRFPMVFQVAALPGWKIAEMMEEGQKHQRNWLPARRAQLREQKQMETDGDD